MAKKDTSDNQGKNPFSNNKDKTPKNPFSIYWIYAAIGIALIAFQLFSSSGSRFPVRYQSTFDQLAIDGYVKDVRLINKIRVDFKLTEEGKKIVKKSNDPKYKALKKAMTANKSVFKNSEPVFELAIVDAGNFEEKVEALNKKITDQNVQFAQENKKQIPPVDFVSDEEINYLGTILNFLLPILILVVIWIFVMRRMTGGSGGGGGGGGQIFNIGKSKAQVYEKGKSTNITFKDVAGLQEAKVEIVEIVEFLKNPQRYTEIGAKIPKGALLVGPPGTGKTLLAKAVAGEAKVPFFSLSGSDFVEMFVGVGASRVRDLFKQAKEKAPAIIFIDEIDAIGRARGRGNSFNTNDERENTLNQLLTEMDGFGTNSGVIILAATNRADVLDSALMRAGRFDRQIYVDMPDINERKEIFMVHLKPLKLAEGLDIDFLAKQTPGFSGADIANLCNEAALFAARKNKKQVEKQDFLDAVDRIVGGLEKKNKIITKHEKEVIAFHEAGHASVSWLLEHASPLIKVTIVPRGQSLGAAWYLPEERSITTTEQLLDEMCATLGGRAAEFVQFGRISTGALSDLEKVTKQAYAMVSVYGLNEKLGNISYYDSRGRESFTKPYSEETARTIDQEVSKIIEMQYQRAIQLLTDNKVNLERLAEQLLISEVLFKEDLQTIFGKRPWATEEDIPLMAETVEQANEVPNFTVTEEETAATAAAEQKKADEAEKEDNTEETAKED
ncbi:MAG: ATP-dependent zinc metalloprotease FtsH [Bacteroidota bacterium]